ncbi:aminotransferase V [Companilactobacillus sp. RD055328]|uniref:cysteine desulfurase family protein n=1 Tax=Companilactobacillus sp. RD055328 TaxID=2916634 RepID=UPI001FC85436|nr:cysteine desulfurase family protein [Companilactobacillus sp. RD055328]GKQ42864.1 aminotransferase V [Companilactobacillus sp. RD055328]
MIYFDNSATTKVNSEVLNTYNKVSTDFYGNPSSLHKYGEKAFQLLTSSRQQIAELLKVKPSEIFFTSGGTEGNNWIIKGTAMEKRVFGKHIITTSIEHPAVINSVKQLEKLGYEVTYLPVDKNGFVRPEDVKQAIRKDTILVSIMAVNNEIGTIQPINEISEILTEYPTVHFHVDAVQAIGKNLEDQYMNDRVDFMTFSGHKFHAPRGVGFVYYKEGKRIEDFMTGGGQEAGQRSGTENTPAIAAMAKALRMLKEHEDSSAKQQLELKKMLVDHLEDMNNVTIFSPVTDKYAPNIICFALHGVRGETIVHAFEEYDIYISTTSACSSKKGVESGTLKAMQVPENIATSAVRVSLDDTNTKEEMLLFINALDEIYNHFQILN